MSNSQLKWYLGLRTLKHLPDNKDGRLISINVLEFVVVIIDYCAALTIVMTENVTDDPHPVLLNVADNTSAHSWTMHTCKSSRLGRLLARWFLTFSWIHLWE